MTLAPGTRLGSYEVLSLLGTGGMGEVYRAHDASTGRDVALKVLPAMFAADPERLTRFEREARALGGLNHPNIAAIYGVEDRGDRPALVMELVAGEDLSERITRGPVPVAEALAISRQIADALSSAHDAGIVHRDLKPANVKVRDDGVVKVLDFGLAKSVDPSAAASATDSPTLTARATMLGTIIGTAAYMAPEQAKGKPVDKRADIWAFGVVLFEMLAGQRAFPGDDISEVLASVLKTEPEWKALPAGVPAPVRHLLRRCLEKDPRQRLRDLGEGIRQLDEAPLTSRERPDSPWWRPVLPVAAAVILTAVAVTLMHRLGEPAASSVTAVRFVMQASADAPFMSTAVWDDLDIAPDGSFVVYTTTAAATSPWLRIHAFDQYGSAPLRGTESAVGPFISPDGHWIGYIDAANPARLKKVPVTGGAPTTIGLIPAVVSGATWTDNGQIVAGTSSAGLFKIGDGGGEPIALTTLDAKLNERTHKFPSAIPGTDVVLFCTFSAAIPRLAAMNMRTGAVARFDIQGCSPKYVPSGHVVFGSLDGTLRAVAFDPARLEIRGNVVPVLEGVGVKQGGAANFAIAGNGTLVFAQGSGLQLSRTIVWVDRQGKETATSAPSHTYFYARVSPDGARLALDARDQEADMWIWDTRGTMRRLTRNAGTDQYGIWTPDGARIVFQSDFNQTPGLYVTRADAIGEPELILARAAAFPNAITPDGKAVLFRASTTATKNDVLMIPIDGPNRQVTTLIQTPNDEYNAALSEDGKWLAFESDASGRFEIYVRPFPDVNSGQEMISTTGGTEPVWAPGSREIIYLGGDSQMYSVALTVSSGKPVFAAPVPLFDAKSYFFGGLGRNYDISIDGKRFAMVKGEQTKTPAPEPLRAVLHWTDELKRIK